jgi:hypothetical protein
MATMSPRAQSAKLKTQQMETLRSSRENKVAVPKVIKS